MGGKPCQVWHTQALVSQSGREPNKGRVRDARSAEDLGSVAKHRSVLEGSSMAFHGGVALMRRSSVLAIALFNRMLGAAQFAAMRNRLGPIPRGGVAGSPYHFAGLHLAGATIAVMGGCKRGCDCGDSGGCIPVHWHLHTPVHGDRPTGTNQRSGYGDGARHRGCYAA